MQYFSTSGLSEKILAGQKTTILALLVLVSFFTSVNAQTKIGGLPGPVNPYAYLQLGDSATANRGLLVARVTLVATTQAAPLGGHVAGMMVYNLSSINDVVPGFYYNDGAKWVLVAAAQQLNTSWLRAGNAATNVATDFVGTTDSQALAIKTFNSEAIRVTPGQRIGIGTSTPNSRLELNSGLTDSSGLRFTKLLATSPAAVVYNSKVLSVDSNGNVGLTAIPGTQVIVDFSVNTDPNTAGTTFNPNQPSDPDVVYLSTIDNSSWSWNGTGYIAYTTTTTTWIQGGNSVTAVRALGTKSNFALPFITNNVEAMRIDANQNLGVGTTIPSEKLEVNGTVKASNFTTPVQSFSGSTVIWNMSSGATAKWTLAAGANTLAVTNMKAGMYGSIIVTNTGTSTVTFSGGTNKVINAGSGAPTLTQIAGAVDVLSFLYDGTTFWWTVGNNFN